MARTAEDVLRFMTGNMVLQIAGLTALVEQLQEEVAAEKAKAETVAKAVVAGP